MPGGKTFRKRPVEITATRWWRNGDHPDDYTRDHPNPDGTVWTADERRAARAEGDVVRYYRPPHVDGDADCGTCGVVFHNHGWIDTPEGGHIVCPGDWIVTGVEGERYPVKPSVFASTYEQV